MDNVLRPIGCVGEKSFPGEWSCPTLPEDAQIHKENITNWRQAFPAPLRGLTFYLISTPGQGPGLCSYHPRRLWLTGIKGGTLPLMRSVTYLMVCSLPSSGYPSFSAPSSLAASPGLHPARHRDFTPNSTNCGYGEVRIYTESLSYTNTNIVHPTQQIIKADGRQTELGCDQIFTGKGALFFTAEPK